MGHKDINEQCFFPFWCTPINALCEVRKFAIMDGCNYLLWNHVPNY